MKKIINIYYINKRYNGEKKRKIFNIKFIYFNYFLNFATFFLFCFFFAVLTFGSFLSPFFNFFFSSYLLKKFF